MPTQTEHPAEQTIELSLAKPVFVDPSGRRRRVVRIVAVVACILLTGYASLLLVALTGGPVSPHALLPISGPSASAPPTTEATTTNDRVGPTSHVATSVHFAVPVTTTLTTVAPTTTQPVVTTPPTSVPPSTRTHGPPTPPGWSKHP